MTVLGGKKESIWEQHETKFKRIFLFRKNNVSCSASLCSHKRSRGLKTSAPRMSVITHACVSLLANWPLLSRLRVRFAFSEETTTSPESLSNSQPNPSLSSSHYVWSNPGLLEIQSRTPAPCGWDCSGQEDATSATTPRSTVYYLYSESFPGLERSALEAELSTASRHIYL